MNAKFIVEKFIEDSDAIVDIGIGKIYLIKKWFKFFKIDEETFNRNIIINSDNTLNLKNDVLFKNVTKNLRNFPDYIKFNETESFNVSNIKLKTLKGCPNFVNGNFNCAENNLTSLDYCPKEVTKDFICYKNNKFFDKEEILKRCKVGGNIINEVPPLEEKFIEDSDPIEDLGIGIYSIHNFDSYNSAVTWLIDCLPAILKIDEIPDDIITDDHYFLNKKYNNDVEEYVENYIEINKHNYHNFDVRKIFIKMYNRLSEKGFQDYSDKNVYGLIEEKFIEDISDPIRQMGIGVKVIRNFETRDEIIQFLLDNLPYILKTNGIPDDIIYPEECIKCFFEWDYWNKIDDYIRKYIRYRNKLTDFSEYDRSLRKQLHSLGFKTRTEE